MRFRAGELEFNATIAEASESPSRQTGDLLRTLTIQFRAQKAPMHELALAEAELRLVGGLFSLSDLGEPELEWRVRSSTFNYVGTEPWGINHHVWWIEQVERVACSRLLIGPVALEPYDYAEAVSDTGIVRLVVRCTISAADLDALSRVSAAVPVVRTGISDTPREMTIEYVWGERPQGLAVVIRCVDAAPEPRLTLNSATLTDDGLTDLIAVLSAKGVLDDADLAHLRRLRHNARHVSSVDGWALTS